LDQEKTKKFSQPYSEMMHISKVYSILCFLALFAVSREVHEILQVFSQDECKPNKWLGATQTVQECWDKIRARENECDQTYFNYVARGDRNCGCIDVGTDCTNSDNLIDPSPGFVDIMKASEVFPTWEIVPIVLIGAAIIAAVIYFCFCRKKNKKITPAMNQYTQQQIYNQQAQPYHQQQPYSQPQHCQQQPQYHQQQPQYHQQQSYQVIQHQIQVVESCYPTQVHPQEGETEIYV